MLCLRNIVKYRTRLSSRNLPSCLGGTAIYNGVGIRSYASPTAGKKTEDAPSFKKIFLVAILGTLVFMQTANSLDKNKPKTSYSEEEFENVMSGLKRRVSLFPAGALEVKLIPRTSEEILKKVREGSEIVIEPKEVVEYFRGQKDGTYEALLEEVKSKHGADYFEKLPNGMLVMLIGKYMKEKCRTNDRVIIADFPHSIADAIKFENDVCTVSKVVTDKANANSEVCQYYETVRKVQQV
ncbi:hypothetical protein HG536_0A02870 [Torulaspora globosa]|uniref:Altered inheritance of mitochondria protein 36, mitochondrial n=1 Tax=Torulaspora globosa TaxID=48254 RepID=A0A7G3ZAD4_9SACH|nr:uncharacterized protein HG536_0A02870 [Torulaspora globosa]QLL30470.1 hypothetical protein HG536_0A02870 [Torulaspora globosa]